MRIDQVGVRPQLLPSRPAVGRLQQSSFADMLSEGLERAGALHAEADMSVLQLAAGQTDNVHEVMAALERASLALELTIAIRNKLVESYQEIVRMQV